MLSPKALIRIPNKFLKECECDLLTKGPAKALTLYLSCLYGNLAQRGVPQDLLKEEAIRTADQLGDMMDIEMPDGWKEGDTELATAMADLGAEVWTKENWTDPIVPGGFGPGPDRDQHTGMKMTEKPDYN